MVPAVASAAPVAVDLGSEGTPQSVACPSTSQCTAISDDGDAATFDPASPGTPKPITVDNPPPEPGTGPRGSLEHVAVVCPATDQCTLVDSDGRVVTFNPLGPGHPQPVAIDRGDHAQEVPNELSFGALQLACPSTQQCTAVDYAGDEVTFNPLSPGTPAPVSIDGGAALRLLACPSTEQCTAADARGHVVTFDPRAPGAGAPVTISHHQLTSLACPITELCVATDEAGRAVTFNPLAPSRGVQAPFGGTIAANGVSCPSASQCTAVGQEEYVTFDPTVRGTLVSIDVPGTSALTAVSCPSESQCTAVDMLGGEETFDPLLPVVSRASLSGVSTRRARLSFTLTSGTTTALLKAITVSLPAGLGVSGARHHLANGVVVSEGARRLGFTASTAHNTLVIALDAPASRVKVTVSGPAVLVAPALARNVSAERVKTLAVGVTATSTRNIATPGTLNFYLAARRPLRLGIPRRVRVKLLSIAIRAATRNGDPHPYDVQAVLTTHELVNRLNRNGGGAPASHRVYYVALRGHFVCGLCSVPPGARAPSGSVITLELPAPLGSRGESSFGVLSRYPDLKKLGSPVRLGA